MGKEGKMLHLAQLIEVVKMVLIMLGILACFVSAPFVFNYGFSEKVVMPKKERKKGKR